MALSINRIKNYFGLVQFEHTIFALPFAYIGAIMAKGSFPSVEQSILILLAMIGARTAAMALNRLIDCEIDKRNPRTMMRHLPQGHVSSAEAAYLVTASLLVFIWSAYRLSPAYLPYLPLLIVFLAGYSYTKRFTWLSHICLGITIGFAPLCAWVAVSQKIEYPALVLSAAVACWIAGFDIIYALLDIDFDRQQGLYSLPATWGICTALKCSRILHLLTVVLLLSLLSLLELGRWYTAGVVLTVVLLAYEHYVVNPFDNSTINAAFFSINGLISIQLCFFVVVDIIL